MTAGKGFVHVVATVVLTVAEPCLQDASFGVYAEHLLWRAHRTRAVALVLAKVAVDITIANVVLIYALPITAVDHGFGTLVGFIGGDGRITSFLVTTVLTVHPSVTTELLVYALFVGAMKIFRKTACNGSTVEFIRRVLAIRLAIASPVV